MNRQYQLLNLFRLNVHSWTELILCYENMLHFSSNRDKLRLLSKIQTAIPCIQNIGNYAFSQGNINNLQATDYSHQEIQIIINVAQNDNVLTQQTYNNILSNLQNFRVPTTMRISYDGPLIPIVDFRAFFTTAIRDFNRNLTDFRRKHTIMLNLTRRLNTQVQRNSIIFNTARLAHVRRQHRLARVTYWKLRDEGILINGVRRRLNDAGARKALRQMELGEYLPAYMASRDDPRLWPYLARHMFNSKKKRRSRKQVKSKKKRKSRKQVKSKKKRKSRKQVKSKKKRKSRKKE